MLVAFGIVEVMDEVQDSVGEGVHALLDGGGARVRRTVLEFFVFVDYAIEDGQF